jgi:hypothetical protein
MYKLVKYNYYALPIMVRRVEGGVSLAKGGVSLASYFNNCLLRQLCLDVSPNPGRS